MNVAVDNTINKDPDGSHGAINVLQPPISFENDGKLETWRIWLGGEFKKIDGVMVIGGKGVAVECTVSIAVGTFIPITRDVFKKKKKLMGMKVKIRVYIYIYIKVFIEYSQSPPMRSSPPVSHIANRLIVCNM